MVKSIGKKINTAVFISGRGSNLKSLIKHSKFKNSPIKIKLVISNKKDAKGLKYAKNSKINFFVNNFKNKSIAEKNVLSQLSKEKIEIICLAGFMKILSKSFIRRFKKPILNIHPSLLPKYKGLNTHQRAIENKDKYSGCTVHFVNAKLDSGKIILQKRVNIYKKDTPDRLAIRILAEEHKLYPKAILKIFSL